MRSIYKHIFYPISLIITAVVIVGLLLVFSGQFTHQQNGFTRSFFNKKLILVNGSSMRVALRSICGYSVNNLYFETNIPGKILETDWNLNNGRFIHFSIPSNGTINSLFSTFIDSTTAYIMAGNVPAIFLFNLYTREEKVYHFSKNNFTRSVVTGRTTFVLRSYKKFAEKWEQELIKWDPVENIIIEEKSISIKRGDAGFSTDGLLHYDKESNRLLYVNYYINNFICLDTNLELIYKSHTIDTIGTIQTEANTLGKKNYSVTNTSPIRNVNLQSCVSKGNLYINSAVIADNETRKSFTGNSAIDIYSIADGLYKGSFYIPGYKGKRLKEFRIYNNKIIVLYPKHIAVFQMNPDL